MTTPFYMIRRDYGPHGWGYVDDGADTQQEAEFQLIESFHDDAMPASLATVQVRLLNDGGCRDVTEDVLRAVGAWLSRTRNADTFPAAWLQWADDEIQAEHAYRAEVAMAADARRYDGEAA